MTAVLRTASAWREARPVRGSLGFVPTMGALHDGHRSLIERSSHENDSTVVSIYVNPTQFDDPADLDRYPRTGDADLDLLESLGVDFLFTPEYSVMYPDDGRFSVQERGLSDLLCGAHRSGHFTGVLTVIARLFNLIRPTRAYFGEKDYQQYLLVGGLVDAMLMDIEVVPCPTVREADGLAVSSRNRLLSESSRAIAGRLFEALTTLDSTTQVRRALEDAGFDVQYVEEYDGRRFAAAVLDGVRLIDNIPLAAAPSSSSSGRPTVGLNRGP